MTSTYRKNCIVSRVEGDKNEDCCRSLCSLLMSQHTFCHLKSQLSHYIVLSPLEYPPLSCFSDVTVQRLLVQELERLSKFCTSLQKLCFVCVISHECLTVDNVPIHFILRVLCFLVFFGVNQASESEKIGDIASNNRNCEAVVELA